LKILLTGASGFVGSHILDSLRARGLDTALLLRPASPRRLIEPHLAQVDVRLGSLSDPASLPPALAGITHVIHCAGCTRARKIAEFYEVNEAGTRRLVDAVNQQPEVRRLIHVSSLAAAGPALPANPAREGDRPCPVSHYGRSKLAGELAVRNDCRKEYVIIRPPAVYGPRDADFLRLFKAVRRHIRPWPWPQPLSLVFVCDLAEAIVACLEPAAAARKTYFAASPEIVTARQMAEVVAARLRAWTLRLPLPRVVLWTVCLAQEIGTHLTGKASVLSLQKWPELRAPGWVCDPARLRVELGIECPTTLEQGIAQTLAWYRENQWL
jgi:nucleoside-diphosphate-sugar epimerase